MNSPETILDPTLDIAGQFHRSAGRLFRILRAFRPEKGLSLTKFSILARLYQDADATATALAAFLRIQPQSITRILAELERDQLIERRLNPKDRRQSLIKITTTGGALLLEEIREQQLKLAKIIAQSLTPIEQEMLRLAAGLMDRLAAEAEACFDQGKASKKG